MSGDTAAAQEAAVALQVEYQTEAHDLRMSRLDTERAAIEAWNSRQTAMAEQRASDEVRRNQQTLSAVSSLTSGLESTFADLAQAQAEAGGQGAMALFALQQTAAQASIIASAAEGYARAAALPPPANGIMAAAVTVGIVGAEAKLATATPPSYGDTPGPLRAGPGGLTAMFAPGDLVVAGRDERDLDRQVGGSSAPAVILRDTDRHLGRYGARDAMRAPGQWDSVRRQSRRTVGRR